MQLSKIKPTTKWHHFPQRLQIGYLHNLDMPLKKKKKPYYWERIQLQSKVIGTLTIFKELLKCEAKQTQQEECGLTRMGDCKNMRTSVRKKTNKYKIKT
jgi:hypothetical protein